MVSRINECSKLAQKKYKSRYDWVGKVVHWELCKGLKFDPADECYMHKPESFLGFLETTRSLNLGQKTRLTVD